MATYTTFPYRTEFPDFSERGRNSKTLEDALWWARWPGPFEMARDERVRPRRRVRQRTETAVITNRNTGYRWIVRRGDHRVEFQTPEMLEDVVSDQRVELHLTVEEAEALARAPSMPSSRTVGRRRSSTRRSIRSRSSVGRSEHASRPAIS